LRRPRAAYRSRAALAAACLLVFVLLYFGLTGAFLLSAWRLVAHAEFGQPSGLAAYSLAACALLLAAFMLKALFSIRPASPEGLLEVTPEQQPRLFRFLHELADAAGAPRPHKVFVSARVNAAVFYELSLASLFVPAPKNLEIGLALVNALTLGELRAVLAHEFGHFAQRSMALGRWVCVAQQIAGQLLARRDKFDATLSRLGEADASLKMVLSPVRLLIWSIRSLMEPVFGLVLLAQRALSREMEMQADLVAVALTGSDALVHALHRLPSADDAWARTLQFAQGERSAGRATRDLFAIQKRITERMAAVLDEPGHGQPPPLPPSEPERHRLFQPELGQLPRMWLTHPHNHEREANAKRRYLAAPIDPSPAWSLFAGAGALRQRISAGLQGAEAPPPAGLAHSLAALERQFQREPFEARYCGVYFRRPLTRHVCGHRQLRDPAPPAPSGDDAPLYPASLREEVRRLRRLEPELGQLSALIAGALSAPGGVVRLRGEEFRRRQLPLALRRVQDEVDAVTRRLREHDFRCRSWHRGAAARIGGGWGDCLDGLLALLHYAEHTEANLRDAHGLLRHSAQVALAAGGLSDADAVRLLGHAAALQRLIGQVYRERDGVRLERAVAARLDLAGDWSGLLGECTLPAPSGANLHSWMPAADSWIGHLCACLSSMREAALEQLLVTEDVVAQHAREAWHPAPPALPAPPAPRVPVGYPILLLGAERKRDGRPGWWSRFQRADGFIAGMARMAVASAVVAGVLGMGSGFGGPRPPMASEAAATLEKYAPMRLGAAGSELDPPH
jgi:Zn-dependent protease with chaperone function